MSFGRFVVCAGIASLAAACAAKSPGDLARSYGMLEHTPPSKFHGPGQIVRADNDFDRNSKSIELRYVCDAKDVPNTMTSPTTSVKYERKVDSSAELKGPDLEQFDLGANAKYVSSVTLTFTNVKVIEVSDQSLNEVIENAATACKRAIRRDLGKGVQVFQVTKVLEADLNYKVTFEGSISANVKATITEKIKGSIGGKITRQGQDEIVGEGLYYGVDVEPVKSI